MAKLENVIKKIEALTGNKVVKHDGNEYVIEHNGYFITFRANGRAEAGCSACGYYTYKKGQERTMEDVYSEYWPGSFHDNIVQAFNSTNRKIAA